MSDVDDIRLVLQQWVQASSRGDVPALLNLVTDDIVFFAPGPSMVRGKALVEAMYRDLLARADIVSEVDDREMQIEVHGDIAIVWGLDGARVTMKATNATTCMHGYAMSVLRREPDGWKFARGINAMTRRQETVDS